MVIGMAHGIIERVPPAEQAEYIQEEFIEPLRAKHCAMSQFMRRHSVEEAAHHALDIQRYGEPDPHALRPEVIGQDAGGGDQDEVPAGL